MSNAFSMGWADVAERGPTGRVYNDDLLIDENERRRVGREQLRMIHLLDHPELRTDFAEADRVANARKRSAQSAGFWAVIGAVLALGGAATEPLWHGQPHPWPIAIAAGSAALGLVAFAIAGIGLLHGKRKHEWLRLRLKTERLRQFHFQTFLFHLPDMLDSLASDDAAKRYRRKRTSWLQQFRERLNCEEFASVSAIVSSRQPPLTWVHGEGVEPQVPVLPTGEGLDAVFSAYKDFRLRHQEAFAEYMLRVRNDRPAGAGSSRRRTKRGWARYPGMDLPLKAKAKVLRDVFRLAVLVLVVLHVGVLAGTVVGIDGLHSPWIHVAVMLWALVAVAAKTLTEGLVLERNIERFEEYRVAVGGIIQRFQAAAEPEKKFRLMVEMEKATYDEMRSFIRCHDEATFVM